MKVEEFLEICGYNTRIRISMEQIGTTWTSECGYREYWRGNSTICRAEIQNIEAINGEFMIWIK